MVTITFIDEAHRFRIEIEGRLAGKSVKEIRERWHAELLEASPRTFTVDISGLTGCDAAGIGLLREMHAHGTNIAARTPRALGFLSEISSPVPAGPTLVYKAATEAEPKRETKAAVTPFPLSKAAGAGG